MPDVRKSPTRSIHGFLRNGLGKGGGTWDAAVVEILIVAVGVFVPSGVIVAGSTLHVVSWRDRRIHDAASPANTKNPQLSLTACVKPLTGATETVYVAESPASIVDSGGEIPSWKSVSVMATAVVVV